MSIAGLSIEDKPNPRDVRALEDGLYKYNVQQTGHDDGRGIGLFLARGCTRVTLDTFSFQAPGFYQKLGYEIVSVLEDFPVGHKHYTLVKRLSDWAPGP